MARLSVHQVLHKQVGQQYVPHRARVHSVLEQAGAGGAQEPAERHVEGGQRAVAQRGPHQAVEADLRDAVVRDDLRRRAKEQGLGGI